MMAGYFGLRMTLRGLGLLICFLIAADSSEGCSRILWNTNKQAVVVARTTDWYQPFGERLVIYPRGIRVRGDAGENSSAWTSKFGSVGVVTYDLTSKNIKRGDGAEQDPLVDWNLEGMNEKGLAAHLLYLPGTKYEERDQRPGVLYSRWVRYILDNFGTVKDAVSAIRSVQIVPVEVGGVVHPMHLALDDATGDSAIIEFIDGRMVIHHGRKHAVMTNHPSYPVQLANLGRYKPFGGTLTDLPGGMEPAQRFVRAAAFLKTLSEPKDHAEAVAHLFSVIRNVSVPFVVQAESGRPATTPTWWTSVLDLTDRVFYFHWTLNLNPVRISLERIDFSADGGVRVLDPRPADLCGDVTDGFVPVPTSK